MASNEVPSAAFLDEYRGDVVIDTAVAYIPILMFFVSLRFYARWLVRAPIGLDDLLALVSLFLQIACSAVVISMVRNAGVGRHSAYWAIHNPEILTVYFKYLLSVSAMYYPLVAVPKLSILAFYERVFVTRKHQVMVHLLAGAVIVTALVCFVATFFMCRPLAFAWNHNIPGKCWNIQAFYVYSTIPNVLTDIFMLILPLPIVWQLNVTLKIKIGLTMAFATGVLGLSVSIVRFVLFFKFNAVEDGTWSSVGLLIWSLVEINAYLIAACLVSLRPIFVRFREGGLRSLFKLEMTHIDHGTNSSTRQNSAVEAWQQRSSIARKTEIQRLELADHTDSYQTEEEADSITEIPPSRRSSIHMEPPPLPDRIYVKRGWEISYTHTDRNISP